MGLKNTKMRFFTFDVVLSMTRRPESLENVRFAAKFTDFLRRNEILIKMHLTLLRVHSSMLLSHVVLIN